MHTGQPAPRETHHRFSSEKLSLGKFSRTMPLKTPPTRFPPTTALGHPPKHPLYMSVACCYSLPSLSPTLSVRNALSNPIEG